MEESLILAQSEWRKQEEQMAMRKHREDVRSELFSIEIYTLVWLRESFERLIQSTILERANYLLN